MWKLAANEMCKLAGTNVKGIKEPYDHERRLRHAKSAIIYVFVQ